MVQCSFGKCTRAFHILCARQHGNVVVVRSADAMLLCFCRQPTPAAREGTHVRWLLPAVSGALRNLQPAGWLRPLLRAHGTTEPLPLLLLLLQPSVSVLRQTGKRPHSKMLQLLALHYARCTQVTAAADSIWDGRGQSCTMLQTWQRKQMRLCIAAPSASATSLCPSAVITRSQDGSKAVVS